MNEPPGAQPGGFFARKEKARRRVTTAGQGTWGVIQGGLTRGNVGMPAVLSVILTYDAPKTKVPAAVPATAPPD